jgi:hypothetical protein
MAKTKTIEPVKKASGRGGYRPNAGRPPFSGDKKMARVRQITNKMLQQEQVPLRVMMNNMVHYVEEANGIEKQFEAQMAENAARFSEEGFLKALELLSKIGDARMKAQKCAVDAAPFIHPKLSNITMDVKQQVELRDIRKRTNRAGRLEVAE